MIDEIIKGILKPQGDIRRNQLSGESPDTAILLGKIVRIDSDKYVVEDVYSEALSEITRFLRFYSPVQDDGNNESITLGTLVMAVRRGNDWVLIGNPNGY